MIHKLKAWLMEPVDVKSTFAWALFCVVLLVAMLLGAVIYQWMKLFA
jgi:phosphatidylserine synthase